MCPKDAISSVSLPAPAGGALAGPPPARAWTFPPLSNTLGALRERLDSVAPLGWLLILTLGCLTPFLNKAFHIDDTLFLRAAEQIQKHPGAFYSFNMNWFGESMGFPLDFDNPPLTCYYIALVASVAGWSEPVLHAAFLLPALAAAWGIFALARSFTNRPLLAGVAALLSPAFIISATNVMCDVMLLALWVWSVVLFERGLESNRWRHLAGSGLLAGFAVLAKFTGLALIPLLAAYGLTRQPRLARWMLAPILPVFFALAYEWYTRRLYGIGLLFIATAYSSHSRASVGTHIIEQAVQGLGYLGGVFLPVLFYAPWLWSRRPLVFSLCVLVPLGFLLPSVPPLAPTLLAGGHVNWWALVQCFLFAVGGLHILLLAANDFWRRRDPASLLLVTWVLGMFVFAVALNWTINGRSFLAAAPAVVILLARRMDLRAPETGRPAFEGRLLWPAFACGVLSLCLARADYIFAGINRTAAERICQEYLKPGRTVWFEGHWGFQYYMEKYGAKAVDLRELRRPAGDVLAVPALSSNGLWPPGSLFEMADCLEQAPDWRFATVGGGAGFYADVTGPLPFVISGGPAARFWIMRAK